MLLYGIALRGGSFEKCTEFLSSNCSQSWHWLRLLVRHFLLVFLCAAIALFVRRCHHILHSNWSILGRLAFFTAIRQAFANVVWVSTEKEWNGIPLPTRFVDDPMSVGFILVICHAHEKITQIYHVGSRDGFDLFLISWFSKKKSWSETYI